MSLARRADHGGSYVCSSCAHKKVFPLSNVADEQPIFLRRQAMVDVNLRDVHLSHIIVQFGDLLDLRDVLQLVSNARPLRDYCMCRIGTSIKRD